MDERLENEDVANETGRPRRRAKSDWPAVILTLTPLVLAGGAVLVLSGAIPTRTHGSTRAYKLTWEQRQAEVDAVVGAVEQRGAKAGD